MYIFTHLSTNVPIFSGGTMQFPRQIMHCHLCHLVILTIVTLFVDRISHSLVQWL